MRVLKLPLIELLSEPECKKFNIECGDMTRTMDLEDLVLKN